MIETLGPTLVCTAITQDKGWMQQLIDAIHIDRLNLGPIPTPRVNYLQPHEGSLVELLFRSRADQLHRHHHDALGGDARVASISRAKHFGRR